MEKIWNQHSLHNFRFSRFYFVVYDQFKEEITEIPRQVGGKYNSDEDLFNNKLYKIHFDKNSKCFQKTENIILIESHKMAALI